VDTSYILCWSAKWLGSDDIMFERTWKRKGSSKAMIQRIHGLLSEADCVVTFNGVKFDLPVLNREFIMHGLNQPAPFQNLDLLKVARSRFRFASNKLQHLSTELGLGTKTPHEGFMLWIKCMDLDKEAWDSMTTYNKQDVLLLEKLYYRLLPWLKNAPNQSVILGRETCPHCGSQQYQGRGYSYTQAGKYRRYQCTKCHSWFRSSTAETRGQKRMVSL